MNIMAVVVSESCKKDTGFITKSYGKPVEKFHNRVTIEALEKVCEYLPLLHFQNCSFTKDKYFSVKHDIILHLQLR